MFLPAIRSTNYVFHMCGWSLIDSVVCAGTSSADFSIPEAITDRIRSAAEQF